jgi:hypothetical protein
MRYMEYRCVYLPIVKAGQWITKGILKMYTHPLQESFDA